MKKESPINLLSSFFLLFNARIEKFKILKEKVAGTIAWENEKDKQDFKWTIDSQLNWAKLKLLIDYLKANDLVNIDKIRVSEVELLDKLVNSGWKLHEAQQSIDELSSFEVKMIDDGEETDSFFIHF